ncbi:hypothetical protein K2173_014765 [Erythroxylum novogranatense]|uniref:B-like cyclin n=1 Tax=Erythroxylum novogranatense TaxID=1862640 RepID=A0AAV8TG07_9ROSI|nr:hypothetical protein K2173_014765 [Erythroxylum novogranatense]
MAENIDCQDSSLLCTENTNICLGDFDSVTVEEFECSPSWHHQGNHNHNVDPFFYSFRSKSLMGLTVLSDERVKEMIDMESEHLPRGDYLKRLRSGDLDLNFRREAVDWILKVQAHHDFGALSICLSVNYLDRFLSIYVLPKDKAWALQLLAVACLSLAAKMEENKVPLSVDLQVGEPKFVFEAKTIQRMELLVLNALNWRTRALTPCSFIDYFLWKVHDHQYLSPSSLSRSVQLILGTMKGIDFLEFRPSEIAAAVAISVSGREKLSLDIDKATPSFIHVEKGRVLKCIELIKDRSLTSGCTAAATLASVSASSVPQSPNGVLDSAACLSYKTDDTTVGSCANS